MWRRMDFYSRHASGHHQLCAVRLFSMGKALEQQVSETAE